MTGIAFFCPGRNTRSPSSSPVAVIRGFATEAISRSGTPMSSRARTATPSCPFPPSTTSKSGSSQPCSFVASPQSPHQHLVHGRVVVAAADLLHAEASIALFGGGSVLQRDEHRHGFLASTVRDVDALDSAREHRQAKLLLKLLEARLDVFARTLFFLERVLGVLPRQLQKLRLRPALRLYDPHPSLAVFAQQLFERFAHLDRHRNQNLVGQRGPIGVVLAEQRAEHLVVGHRDPPKRQRATPTKRRPPRMLSTATSTWSP